MKPEQTNAPVIAVSACLLGEPVRYDGGHKRNGYVADVLSRHFSLVSFCPEMEAGLGAPREPIDLVSGPDGTRAIQAVTDRDLTGALRDIGRRAIGGMPGVCGFVFKSRSPSCAVSSAPVEKSVNGSLAPVTGAGVYAGAVMAAAPDIPVIEDAELADSAAREAFLNAAAAYAGVKPPWSA